MTPTTNILDVLPDGTIKRVSFSIPAIINVLLTRSNHDEQFSITSCDVWSRDEEELAEAVSHIQKAMRGLDIDVMIPIVSKGEIWKK